MFDGANVHKISVRTHKTDEKEANYLDDEQKCIPMHQLCSLFANGEHFNVNNGNII